MGWHTGRFDSLLSLIALPFSVTASRLGVAATKSQKVYGRNTGERTVFQQHRSQARLGTML